MIFELNYNQSINLTEKIEINILLPIPLYLSYIPTHTTQTEYIHSTFVNLTTVFVLLAFLFSSFDSKALFHTFHTNFPFRPSSDLIINISKC